MVYKKLGSTSLEGRNHNYCTMQENLPWESQKYKAFQAYLINWQTNWCTAMQNDILPSCWHDMASDSHKTRLWVTQQSYLNCKTTDLHVNEAQLAANEDSFSRANLFTTNFCFSKGANLVVACHKGELLFRQKWSLHDIQAIFTIIKLYYRAVTVPHSKIIIDQQTF